MSKKETYTVPVNTSIDYKQHLQYNWKGVIDNKNILAVDQESFEDCCNMYVDDENVLRSRPALKRYFSSSKLHCDTEIFDVFVFDTLLVYYCANSSTHNTLKFIDGDKIIDVPIVKNTRFNLIEADECIFVFKENGLDYYDLLEKKYYTTDASILKPDTIELYELRDKVYVPITTQYETDKSIEQESENELITETIEVAHLHVSNTDKFLRYIDKKVRVKYGNVDEDIVFVENTQYSFLQQYFAIPKNIITDSYLSNHNLQVHNIDNFAKRPTISISANNQILIPSYSSDYIFYSADDIDDDMLPWKDRILYRAKIEWQLYYSIDGKSIQFIDKLSTIENLPVLGIPKISHDGTLIACMTAKSLYVKSLTNDGEFVDWTDLLAYHGYNTSIGNFDKINNIPLNWFTRSDYSYNAHNSFDFDIHTKNNFAICYGVNAHNSTYSYYGYSTVEVLYCNGERKLNTHSIKLYGGVGLNNNGPACLREKPKISYQMTGDDAYIATIFDVDGLYDSNLNSRIGLYVDKISIIDNTIHKIDYGSGTQYVANVIDNCIVNLRVPPQYIDIKIANDFYALYYLDTVPDKFDYCTNIVKTTWNTHKGMHKTTILYTLPHTYEYYDEQNYVRINDAFLVTNDVTFYYNKAINRIFNDMKYYPVEGNIYAVITENASNELYYTSLTQGIIDIFMTTPGEYTNLVFDKIILNSEYYASLNKRLYISSTGSDTEDFKWYFPKQRSQDFETSINNLHTVGDGITGVFTNNGIYYANKTVSDTLGTVFSYLKSKINLQLLKNSDILTTFDGASIVYPTKYGLVGMQYETFIASTDQTLNYLSTNIEHRFNEYCKSSIKLTMYKNWLFCYKENSSELYVFDMRTSTWWPMKAFNVVNKIIEYNNELLIIIDGRAYYLDTSIDAYFEDIDEKRINWFFKSQRLHLSTLNYYKTVSQIMFVMANDYEDIVMTNAVMAVLNVTGYRKFTTRNIEDTREYELDLMKNFIKRCNMKCSEFQYKVCSSDELYIHTPIKITTIGIKYRLTSAVR